MVSRDAQRANVLFVLADDLANWGLNCYGNPDARTPVIDGLAERGVRFSHFFCTSPVCSPSRASIYTGLIPSQHGVHDWVSGAHSGDDGVDFLQGRATIVETLADRGYRAAMIGKWHLGASDRPRAGFVHWFAHERGGGPYYGAPMFRDDRAETAEGYISDVLAEEALEFIDAESANDSPFWLSLHFTAPHHPWIDSHPSELVELYADTEFPVIPREAAHPWLLRTNPEVAEASDDPLPSLRGYFAAVSGMDRALGRVLEGLERHGLTESTLVIFMSDNGFNAGHHGVWGKGNGTYPQNMYDTSVTVPCIISQPGRTQQGRVSDTLLSGYDVAATVFDYLLPDPPALSQSPGRSFRSELESVAPSEQSFVVVHDEYGPVRMVRTDRWKLIRRGGTGPDELFDLLSDPDETTSVLDDEMHAEIVADLTERLEGWFRRNADPAVDGAQLPVTGFGQMTPLPTDKPKDQQFRPLHAPPVSLPD